LPRAEPNRLTPNVITAPAAAPTKDSGGAIAVRCPAGGAQEIYSVIIYREAAFQSQQKAPADAPGNVYKLLCQIETMVPCSMYLASRQNGRIQ
jgi:hypothetical protein